MSPALSLAMPVRNGERFIEAAVGSLLAQSFTDYELLIVDNASTDATQQICERLTRSDPRIRYFRNKADIGAGANFNRGVELASGVLFKWCAHDDLISPDYLARCIAALAARPSAVTAYGRLLGIDESGALTGYIVGRRCSRLRFTCPIMAPTAPCFPNWPCSAPSCTFPRPCSSAVSTRHDR